MSTSTGDASAIADIVARIDAATEGILNGDGRGWKDLVSEQDDVTLLGAYGGHATGRDEVAGRFDYVASTYTGVRRHLAGEHRVLGQRRLGLRRRRRAPPGEPRRGH